METKAEMMVQQLRTLDTFMEDQGLAPSTLMAAHNHCISSFNGSDTLFWPLKVLLCKLHLNSHRHVHACTYITIINKYLRNEISNLKELVADEHNNKMSRDCKSVETHNVPISNFQRKKQAVE